MIAFLLKRLGVMVLTALCLTLIVFSLVNLKPNLVKLAKEQTGSRITEQQVEVWLDQNGFNRPLLLRYGEWLGGVARGDFGHSTRFNAPVADVLWPRLWLTGDPDVLGDGGDGPLRARSSAFSPACARDRRRTARSRPSPSPRPRRRNMSRGVVLTVIFASQMVGLQWFSGSATKAAEDGPTLYTFALPVLTIAIYGMGYIARMTRASMAEVMTQQYIRTARLKGVSFRGIVLRHALRNALIAPFTVIMLQFPWLLTGVVIVETLFNYRGFGWLLIEGGGEQRHRPPARLLDRRRW